MKWVLVAALALVAMHERAPVVRAAMPAATPVSGHATPAAAPTFERDVDPATGETAFVAVIRKYSVRVTATVFTLPVPVGTRDGARTRSTSPRPDCQPEDDADQATR